MKQLRNLAAIAACLLAFAGCKKEISPAETEPQISEDVAASGRGVDENLRKTDGKVYTLSNAAGGNQVIVYDRSANGMLYLKASYSTGGTGTGGGLGNQGAVVLSTDGETLLAVNPGSNSISSFKVTGNGLNLKSTVASGGTMPVSITQYGHRVFVLNAGGTGNISGFELKPNNKLEPIYNSTKPLSSSASGAAQISFVRNGMVLVVTEKSTNKIITYRVNENGIPGNMHSITSATPTPFGFAPGQFGNIYVSEAAGGAANASTITSYHIAINGSIALNDGPLGAGQSAACWVVLTDNGKYAYTTNTGSGNLSSFRVHPFSGNLSIGHAIAATSGAGPIDAALSMGSDYLYVLNGGSHTISVYSVAENGNLQNIQTVDGIPVGATGMAAK